ncbi:unnamed protein product [Vitrella brassicaformis CCMP3155]|uniref:carbonic anhydrase n=1 Tax=Vitrella brassicaformis (strain CCMP3155) TaxID=1169540 RepID=A0A0G4F3G1_VITBC|nr:unnamed protein product [Vitrella brassicaformis CCMP3155]|eukprot:CEM06366.1 unnamed protein product [Vitrella brassicaformis CCMP3155]
MQQTPISLPDPASIGRSAKALFYRLPPVRNMPVFKTSGTELTLTFPKYIGGFGYDVAFPPSAAYRLYLIRILMPSEHTWQDEERAAEVQLWGRRAGVAPGQTDSIGVASFGVSEGTTASPFLHAVAKDLALHVSDLPHAFREGPLNLSSLFAADDTTMSHDQGVAFFVYNGSLTEEPCCGMVKWFIRATPVRAHAEQLMMLRRFAAQNMTSKPPAMRRPIQPIKCGIPSERVTLVSAVDATSLGKYQHTAKAKAAPPDPMARLSISEVKSATARLKQREDHLKALETEDQDDTSTAESTKTSSWIVDYEGESKPTKARNEYNEVLAELASAEDKLRTIHAQLRRYNERLRCLNQEEDTGRKPWHFEMRVPPHSPIYPVDAGCLADPYCRVDVEEWSPTPPLPARDWQHHPLRANLMQPDLPDLEYPTCVEVVDAPLPQPVHAIERPKEAVVRSDVTSGPT